MFVWFDLSIDINAAVDPISIEWEINPENGISYSFGGGSLGKISSSGNFMIANSRENTIKLFGKSNQLGSESNMPNEFTLHQNFPNPFNPETRISYSIPEQSKIMIKIYDMLGTEVAELVNETKPAGSYETSFNASDLSSGVYIYRITALNGDRILFSQAKQMILVK